MQPRSPTRKSSRNNAQRDAAQPHFDITFLGVGPDGHIASLFPERPGIREAQRTVVAVTRSPKPPPERVESHPACDQLVGTGLARPRGRRQGVCARTHSRGREQRTKCQRQA